MHGPWYFDDRVRQADAVEGDYVIEQNPYRRARDACELFSVREKKKSDVDVLFVDFFK